MTALSRLSVINGVFNALGAVLLLLAPAQLAYGLHLGREANFLWHVIAACSLAFAVLSFAVLSFAARKFAEPRSAVLTLLVFHAATALVSLWAWLDGLSAAVLGNLLVHLIFAALFIWAPFSASRRSRMR